MSCTTGCMRSISTFLIPCLLCVLSAAVADEGTMVRDEDGKDSGFEHVLSFGSKGGGDGQFHFVEDFDLTSDGKRLLVTDAVNSNVQAFDKRTGKFVAKLGGRGDADNLLEKPEGISVAPDGRIFVADFTTGYVKIYSKDFRWLRTFSEYGSAPGDNIKSKFTSIFKGKYYMPEAGNDRISVWDLNGKFLFTFGKTGSADGELIAPSAVKVNSKGVLYVADLKNDRIQAFDKDGRFIGKWGYTGVGDGQFRAPSGIGIDRHDNVYVTEIGNDRVQVFDEHGKFITKFGKRGAEDGEFNNLRGCMVDKATGWVYLADTENHRVQVFKPNKEMEKILSGEIAPVSFDHIPAESGGPQDREGTENDSQISTITPGALQPWKCSSTHAYGGQENRVAGLSIRRASPMAQCLAGKTLPHSSAVPQSHCRFSSYPLTTRVGMSFPCWMRFAPRFLPIQET
jgi:DNA-binding beta-propeller fold protein YncE